VPPKTAFPFLFLVLLSILAIGIRAFGQFENPYHGCPTREVDGMRSRESVYRWHISDSIPFSDSFRMTIENYSALNEDTGIPSNDYSSVAFWYHEEP